MKYIIKESQYNRLFESKSNKIEGFQELIDSKLNYIRNHCVGMDSETYEGNIGFEACDEVESIEKIRVVDVQSITSSHHPYNKSNTSSTILINVIIDYDAIKYKSFDNIIYDLNYVLKTSTGLPININYEVNNIRKDFNW